MELTYTCEKSEKETVALAMRPFRRYFRTMFAISAVMFIVAWAQAVAELMVEGLVAQGGVSLGNFLLFMSLAFAVTVWLRRRRFRRGVVEAYRKRKTNLAEYHLSDEGLYCAHGESKATMPCHDGYGDPLDQGDIEEKVGPFLPVERHDVIVRGPAAQFPADISGQVFAPGPHGLLLFAAAEVDPPDFPGEMGQDFRDLLHTLIVVYDRAADDEGNGMSGGKEGIRHFHAQAVRFRPQDPVFHQGFSPVPADREDCVDLLVQECQAGAAVVHVLPVQVPVSVGPGVGGDRYGIPFFQMLFEQGLRSGRRVEPVRIEDDPVPAGEEIFGNLPDERMA